MSEAGGMTQVVGVARVSEIAEVNSSRSRELCVTAFDGDEDHHRRPERLTLLGYGRLAEQAIARAVTSLAEATRVAKCCSRRLSGTAAGDAFEPWLAGWVSLAGRGAMICECSAGRAPRSAGTGFCAHRRTLPFMDAGPFAVGRMSPAKLGQSITHQIEHQGHNCHDDDNSKHRRTSNHDIERGRPSC